VGRAIFELIEPFVILLIQQQVVILRVEQQSVILDVHVWQ